MKKRAQVVLSRDTGEVHLAQGVIGRGTSTADFERLTGAKRDAREKERTYTLRNQLICKRRYLVIAQYAGRALAQVTLIDDDPRFGTSWDDSSPKKELARRAAHDRLLVRELGRPHQRDDAHYYAEWKFPWGEVQSSFVPRDFSTAIEILYR